MKILPIGIIDVPLKSLSEESLVEFPYTIIPKSLSIVRTIPLILRVSIPAYRILIAMETRDIFSPANDHNVQLIPIGTMVIFNENCIVFSLKERLIVPVTTSFHVYFWGIFATGGKLDLRKVMNFYSREIRASIIALRKNGDLISPR